MTTDTDLGALIARVEGAGGADRELDAMVARAIGRVPAHAMFDYALSGDDTLWWNGLGYKLPAYTASSDAAISLVPEGYWLTFDPHFMDEEGIVRFKGYAFRPDWSRWEPSGTNWLNRIESGLCATPALALTAAALRARLAVADEPHGGKA